MYTTCLWLSLLPLQAVSFTATSTRLFTATTSGNRKLSEIVDRFPTAEYYLQSAKYEASPEDDFFRSFRRKTPLKLQYFLRDSGILRSLVDTLTWTTAVPELVRQHPAVISKFLQLTGFPPFLVKAARVVWKSNEPVIQDCGCNFQRMRYGSHPRQVVDVMQPHSTATKNASARQNLVVFVHGGAWGSGTPAMYRVAASPFLDRGTVVAVVGYRTYPDGNAEDQAADIVASVQRLRQEDLIGHDGSSKITLMGHSSGAHVSAMALLSDSSLREAVDYFVALAGVYDIPDHYKFERVRGVERFSPMAVACHSSSTQLRKMVLHGWRNQSPTRVVANSTTTRLDSFPKTLILHGEKDTTVPVASPIRFAESLQRAVDSAASPDRFVEFLQHRARMDHDSASTADSDVELAILPTVAHVDFITDLMFGGTSREFVEQWMERKGAF